MGRYLSRRCALAGVGSLLGPTLAGCLGGVDAGPTGEWPSYGNDFGNSGHNPDAAGPVSDPDHDPALEIAWQRTVDRSGSRAPVVGDGVVVPSGSLNALDASTGEGDWTGEGDTPSFPVFGTVLIDGTAYVHANDGRLAAFDVADGTEQWTKRLQPRTAPVVREGRLYVRGRSHSTTDDGFESTYGSDAVEAFPLYEIDPESGDSEVVHAYVRRDGDDRSIRRFSNEVAAVGRNLVFHTGSDLRAVDLDTGDERWAFERDSFERMDGRIPVGANGTVYTAANDDGTPILYAVDAGSGEKRWEFSRERFEGELGDPTVADDAVYATHREELLALDAGSGDVQWTTELPGLPRAPGDGLHPKPVVADGVAYATTDRRLWTVDVTDGSEALAYELADPDYPTRDFLAGPTVVDDIAYVPAGGDDTAALYAFQAA